MCIRRDAESTPVEGSRRVFVLRACQLAAGMTLTTAIQGCGSGGGGSPTAPSPMGGTPTGLPVLTATGSATQAMLTIDTASPLARIGGVALVNTGGGQVLVARTGQDTFSALTATCTHQACTINGTTGDSFVCPCHGSRFSTGGAVINGPATQPLQQFGARFAGGVLTINM